MKKALLLFVAFVSFFAASAQTTIRVFDTVLYHDGYAALIPTPAPPPGVIKHRNDLFARKLTTAELQSIGTSLHMKVTIGAACDNYDRIGSVNVALVPKGAATYNPDSVQHIEIGRFITPFMNKNLPPTSVPYNYDINNVAFLFKEASIAASYDLWIELEVFGVPYAANTQVAGCSGRNDVFYGSLEFTTNVAVPAQTGNVLMPLAFKYYLNNYKAGATDTIGKTTRTIRLTLPNALTDAALFLITSNHGANSGGEEYNRRNHYVYFDNDLKLTYKPGRPSCEPFRQYNTQGNGIYGPAARSDAQWQSFSNWCPGDKIDIRRIDLGALAAGSHTFMINVPDAVFAAGQGDIPVSLYLQGKTSGSLGVNSTFISGTGIGIYPNPAGSQLTIEAGNVPVERVSIINMVGATVFQKQGSITGKLTVNTASFAPGIYTVLVRSNGTTTTHKIQVMH